MGKLMSMNSRFFRVMSRVWDIIVLNVLLLICSIPVFTFGAAATAVYDMSLRMLREEEGYIVPGFFRAFRFNFKQATRRWLLCLALLAVCVGDLFAGRLLATYGVQPILTVVSGVQFVLLAAVMQYLFPLTARFENTLGSTLKNSLLLMLSHLPETLLMTLVSLSAFLILFFVPLPEKLFPCFVTLLIILWFAGGIYLNSKILRRIFQTHFASEEQDAEPEEECSDEPLLDAMRTLDGV